MGLKPSAMAVEVFVCDMIGLYLVDISAAWTDELIQLPSIHLADRMALAIRAYDPHNDALKLHGGSGSEGGGRPISF